MPLGDTSPIFQQHLTWCQKETKTLALESQKYFCEISNMTFDTSPVHDVTWVMVINCFNVLTWAPVTYLPGTKKHRCYLFACFQRKANVLLSLASHGSDSFQSPTCATPPRKVSHFVLIPTVTHLFAIQPPPQLCDNPSDACHRQSEDIEFHLFIVLATDVIRCSCTFIHVNSI